MHPPRFVAVELSYIPPLPTYIVKTVPDSMPEVLPVAYPPPPPPLPPVMSSPLEHIPVPFGLGPTGPPAPPPPPPIKVIVYVIEDPQPLGVVK